MIFKEALGGVDKLRLQDLAFLADCFFCSFSYLLRIKLNKCLHVITYLAHRIQQPISKLRVLIFNKVSNNQIVFDAMTVANK